MSASGEGPVLAIDIKGGEERRTAASDEPASEASRAHPRAARALPPLPETMARIALLSSANTDESARRYADLTIRVPRLGVGLLEFHQIDEAREAGRSAAPRGARGRSRVAARQRGRRSAELTGRRTVLRV